MSPARNHRTRTTKRGSTSPQPSPRYKVVQTAYHPAATTTAHTSTPSASHPITKYSLSTPYTPLTTQTMQQYDAYQSSADAHIEREDCVTHPDNDPMGADTHLPPHLRTTPSQAQLCMTPMEYFQTSNAYPYAQHNTYSPLSPETCEASASNTAAHQHTRDVYSLQPSVEIGGVGGHHYNPQGGGAYYIPEESSYPLQETDYEHDLAKFGSQFGNRQTTGYDDFNIDT